MYWKRYAFGHGDADSNSGCIFHPNMRALCASVSSLNLIVMPMSLQIQEWKNTGPCCTESLAEFNRASDPQSVS